MLNREAIYRSWSPHTVTCSEKEVSVSTRKYSNITYFNKKCNLNIDTGLGRKSPTIMLLYYLNYK